MKALLLAPLFLALASCATSRGFDRAKLRGDMNHSNLTTEEDIRKVLALKAQIKPPFKLAVYCEQDQRSGWRRKESEWTMTEKAELLKFTTEPQFKNIISDTIFINEAITEGKTNKDIRLAAARAGADAVLIVKATADTDHYNNPLSITYAAIIPTIFIPGSVEDALYMTNASLWDVRNQFLYLSVDAEATARQIRPAVFINSDHAIQEAKRQAIPLLRTEIAQRVLAVSKQ